MADNGVAEVDWSHVKRQYILVHDQARARAIEAVRTAEAGMVVEIREQKRNLEQNAKFHAMLSDISDQFEWAGQKLDIESWKRLLVAAWMRTRGQASLIVPALDGIGFDVIYKRTSELSRAEMYELTEYTVAWATEKGIRWSDERKTARTIG